MNTEEGQSRKVIAVAKLKSCWMMKYVGGVKVGYKSRARLCKISEWTGQNMRNSYCDLVILDSFHYFYSRFWVF
jgi:hypothetical protein